MIGSPYRQRLVPVFEQGREKIFDHAARPGLDFDGHGYAGREIDELVVDLHLRFVERHARGVDEFLAFRLAAVAGGVRRLLAALIPGRLVARDRVLRYRNHPSVQEAVFREIEGLDLDRGVLARPHEADIAVRHHGLDFEMAVGRDHGEQRLRRGHDAAIRMHGQLLHGADDGRGQRLQRVLFGRLDQLLVQARRLLGQNLYGDFDVKQFFSPLRL